MDDEGAAGDEEETEEVAKVVEELDSSATEMELDAEVIGAADEVATAEDVGAALLDEAAVLETALDALLEKLAALEEEALLDELALKLAPTSLQTLENESAAVSALSPHLDCKQEDISEDSLLQTQAI
ncbi:hypothetical protein KL930_003098 [Ogataea haglerorum]|uniref:Uncharacterized protein n=1 Tax=Ogataea haglerorum TaxID=1937702 RepID=A0AAN6HZE9_9ASCO|nr:uncharacterized protein KL911_002648 [Ogataea haglerorum]KAG7696072.1 hypothetical protein KL915_002436 [Ogataea haglerorum]KAG7696443.1 hypothetical protein KL951_002899 [Ogataea haglerorum]KAG7707112.1 hypothetical protein KL914_002996 [Ogataea haglerorum]KAG7713750.1 hypothetical protein KL913_004774 [Ogataea haglerorum]KAG7714183.1 hypothetical protein KL949_004813 [Ogataea haglerorum]